jgi:uncharacterized protein YfaS (alpha-2-macroglobulin family)
MIQLSSLWLLFFTGINLLAMVPVWAAFDSATLNNSKPLEILRITPSGEDVPVARQIVVTFNQAVVPLGKMERDAAEIPITITPTLSCQWRWLNTSSLACQLGDETAFRPATRYEIEVKPGIMTENQQTLTQPVHQVFITQRPTISYTSFRTWEAPGMPKIRVKFNQLVKRKSVEKHLYFQKPNGQRVSVKEAHPLSDNEAQPASNLPDSVAKAWLITPNTLLPLDTSIQLQVEPGIQSHLGNLPSIEKRKVVSFHTFPQFQFLGVQCTTLQDQKVFLPFPSKPNQHQRCNPLAAVDLLFSSPVTKEIAKQYLLIVPDLAGGRTDYDPWENIYTDSQLDDPHKKDQTYAIELPENLKAYHAYQVKIDNIGFKDNFGRTLAAPVEMAFLTDHRAPKHVFEHEISVLEQGVDSELPLYITNLNQITYYYHLLNQTGWSAAKQHRSALNSVKDIAFKIPFGIRELIPTSAGVVQGYFTTQPDINNADAKSYNWFFSQITPFYLQAKLGHHNTLVWVTDFATGQPVEGANIAIYLDTYAPDYNLPESLATAVTDSQGQAWLPGTAILDPKLEHAYVYGDYQTESRFIIRCQQDQAIALLPLDSAFRVYFSNLVTDYRFYPDMQPKYGHIHTWGTTAQGVYKVGDTVQFKLLVRDQSNETLVAAPAAGYTLQIIDPMGKIVYEVKDFNLSEFGGYHGEFTIPKTAAVGWYSFQLSAKFKEGTTWQPMRVLVSDFTPSPFRVYTELNGKRFQLGESVTINTQANLHAGGPYVDAQTKVNAILSQQALIPKHPQTKGFNFDVYVDDIEDETVYSTEAKLNDHGELATTFTLPVDSKVLYGKLTIESAVRDDRGKDVANSTTADYMGRDRFVGIKETSWMLTAGTAAKNLLLIIDEQGNPVTDTAISVTIERRIAKAAQVKGAGNAYLTRYEYEWVATNSCQEQLTQPLSLPATCTFVPAKAGVYKMTAQIKDQQGRSHQTELRQWATGRDYVLWETGPGNGLEIIPEQNHYKVGETARYLVKNPYPGSQALVTVERLGVIKSWVTTLAQSIEIVEVPVEPDYVPGFFVSVTVMSPRVDKPLDNNQVDLGKPAFRMGYVQTEVKDPYKELIVDIQTDKPVYRPREQVTIHLQAQARQPEVKAQPIELAITVLDESVLDLLIQGRDYFDPYKGFYTLDDLDMENFSLLMKLVGRQKFEKKGANTGGDGGTGLSMRSLFKFVSYWNPAITTDAEGKAQIQFTVPDNLTGWRVLVMAVTPSDRMGLGDASFKVNQPIEIRPVLPNQVMSGDSFQAGFNVMNRTEQVLDMEVALSATGPVTQLAATESSATPVRRTYTLTAKPYQRYTRWLPIQTLAAGTIHFDATAITADKTERDGLTKTLEIRPRRPHTTVATYGTTVTNVVTEAIQFPSDIYTDVGGLKVIASPTVIGGIDGAFEYMRDYLYACWEQKLSKGTMASHYQQLHAYLSPSLTWQASTTLAANTLQLAAEYQAPNGGMAYFKPQDERVSPYLSAYTALAFNWLRQAGYTIPSAVENRLHEYLLTLLRKNVTPDFYNAGMASSVRAVALAALAQQGKVTRSDLHRYQRHVKAMDLFGQAQFLSAALQIPGTQSMRTQVVDMILAHANQTAGRIAFNESLDAGYRHLLSSPLRTQCAILSSLSEYQAKTAMTDQISDIPFKLVRQITSHRHTQGHWENTQENLFCMNALITYARVYETEAPVMTVRSWLDTEPLGETQFDKVNNPPVTFDHALTATDPGRKAQVKLEREGQGRLYYTVRLAYSEKNASVSAVNAGIEVKREYHVERNGKWLQLDNPLTLTTGELVRVDLYVSLPAPRYFVVVNDPIPGGLEPVNRNLATASQLDATKAEGQYAGGSIWFSHDDWEEYNVDFWSFYHQELRHHAATFYSDYLPAGNYHLAYVAQAIAPGEFNIMATHAEEMYEPDIYGKSVPATLKVVSKPVVNSD